MNTVNLKINLPKSDSEARRAASLIKEALEKMDKKTRKGKVKVRKGIVRYYYVIMASNGQVMSVSQKYFSEPNANRAAKKVAENNKLEYEPYEKTKI